MDTNSGGDRNAHEEHIGKARTATSYTRAVRMKRRYPASSKRQRVLPQPPSPCSYTPQICFTLFIGLCWFVRVIGGRWIVSQLSWEGKPVPADFCSELSPGIVCCNTFQVTRCERKPWSADQYAYMGLPSYTQSRTECAHITSEDSHRNDKHDQSMSSFIATALLPGARVENNLALNGV
jgi:hypothetical protein